MSKKKLPSLQLSTNSLFGEIRELIEQNRQQVAVAVNSAMTLLYWQIGKRINEDILQNQHAEYGKQVILAVSEQLTREYGKGWGEKQLRQCMQFAQNFPESEIVYTLCRQLSWSHIRLIMFMEEPLKREFYIEMCKLEKWSVRTFRERIDSMLYESTAISKKPELTIQNDLDSLKNEKKFSPDLVFRNPYLKNYQRKKTFEEMQRYAKEIAKYSGEVIKRIES